MAKINKYRLFLAVPVSQNITHDLKQQLRESVRLPLGHWITAGNVHLTIRFLGSVPVDTIDAFWSAIEVKLVECFNPFECDIASISHFPKVHPRLIAAIVENLEPLQALFDTVNSVVAQFDIPLKLTPFKPHVTLYRCQKHCKPIAPIILTDCKLAVNEIVLYRSESSVTGGIYTKLHSLFVS